MNNDFNFKPIKKKKKLPKAKKMLMQVTIFFQFYCSNTQSVLGVIDIFVCLLFLGVCLPVVCFLVVCFEGVGVTVPEPP